jgi:asparagine synthase (glutamine-hydrolysing)
MFSFCIYDRQQQKLMLCRDRMGIKPLYYYHNGEQFMFASELKSLIEHPNFSQSINPDGISLFLQQGYINAPYSIYKNTFKLQPGIWLTFDIEENQVELKRYYDILEKYASSEINNASESDLIQRLENTLEESFAMRMIADVPVGIFLSGGIDSSLLAALIQKNRTSGVQTFTVGFEDPQFSEAGHAEMVANHLNTDHHELICTEADFKNFLPQFVKMYDEPFGDSSGIVTHFVAKMAGDSVKVCLSADGADELFGGYTKYAITKRWFPDYQPSRNLKDKLVKRLISNTPQQRLINLSQLPFLKKSYTNLENKIFKFGLGAGQQDIFQFFNSVSCYANKESLGSIYSHFCPRIMYDLPRHPNRIISALGVMDMVTYMEGDILTKVDRATMYASIEGREPFLDQKIVEFAMTVPDHYKIRDNKNKYLLRQLLYRYVPKKMIDRPKQGFAIPIKQWLLTSLREELQTMQHDQSFFETFQLHPKNCGEMIGQFLAQRKYVNEYRIWFLFVLHQWYHQWIVKA